MTATQFSILETNIDRVGALVELAESHQDGLLERLAKLAPRPCKGAQFQGVLGRFNFPNQSKFAMARENKYGYAEVVDTSVDAIKVLSSFEETVSSTGPSPGLQVMDALEVLRQYPTLMEIYNDRNTFIRELRDLTPTEADEVYAQIAAQTQLLPGEAKKKTLVALDLVRELYDAVDESIERFNRIKSKALSLAA